MDPGGLVWRISEEEPQACSAPLSRAGTGASADDSRVRWTGGSRGCEGLSGGNLSYATTVNECWAVLSR